MSVGSLFSRVVFPTLIKLSTSELSRISRTLSSELLELFMRSWAQTDGVPVSGVVEGFAVSDSGSGLVVDVSAGLAFRYDSSGIDLTAYDDHPYRLIQARTASQVTLDAADALLDRIDLICVTDGETDARLRTVQIWDSEAGAFGNAPKYLDRVQAPSVIRVTGTPDGAPTAPATPAGYLALATVRVPASAVSLAAATFADVRTLIRGPGALWRDLVQKAGDTMTGELIFGSSLNGAINFANSASTPVKLWSWGSSKIAGLYMVGASLAAPHLELRSSANTTAGSHLEAGKLYAAAAELHLSAKGVPAGIVDKLSKGAAKVAALSLQGAEALSILRTGAFRPVDAIPATTDTDNFRDLVGPLVPFAMADVVTGAHPNPPTANGTPKNLDFSSASMAVAGLYKIPFQVTPAAAGATNLIALVTPKSSTAIHASVSFTATEVWVYLWDAAGAATTTSFGLAVYALP